MNYKEVKGEKLSILGYGCMRFPHKSGKIDMVATERQILKAYENGVNYYDTAYIYAGSEEALGAILHKNNLRKKVNITSKLPLMMVRETADFDKLFNESCRRLQTDYIDYYLMHNMCTLEEWERLCKLGVEGWIAGKIKEGRIRRIGFSFHGAPDEFIKLINAYDWDFCQIQYNYANINYQAGQSGLKAAAAKGLMVVIMEPLLGGKLANALPPRAQHVIEQDFGGKSPARVALQWLWNQPEITVVLSGMSDDKQVEENLQIASEVLPNSLSEKELAIYPKLIKAFQSEYKINCTGCNYCQPCPKGINIPAVFSAYNMSFTVGKMAAFQQYVMSIGMDNVDCSVAKRCIKCKKCEEHCPQNLEITDELVRISKRLHPWWLPFGFGVVRKILYTPKKSRSQPEKSA